MASPSFLVGSKPSAACFAGRVVLVQRADRLRLVVDVELGDEVLQRVGRDRLAGGVARLEQVDDLGVEDLVGLGAGFGEDGAAVLCIGEHGAVLPFVDEAAAPAVDHDAVGVAEAVASVGEFARGEVAPVGRDRGGVAAAPLAPGHGADGHGHAQAVALIVRGAAHLGATDQWTDVLGAHLHVGLEAAAAEDNGSGESRHPRPDQGHAGGTAGRRFNRRAVNHHRGHGGRQV